MLDNVYILVENVKNIKLLALFSLLKERDKDIVIDMSESLVKRCKNDKTKMICNFVTEKRR